MPDSPVIFFKLAEVPDPNYVGFRGLGKHPKLAIYDAMTHLLRFLAALGGATCACLRYSFTPSHNGSGLQSRLTPLIGIRSRSHRRANELTEFLKAKPFSGLFPMSEVDQPKVSSIFKGCCIVTRTYGQVPSLVPQDLNALVPSSYFYCKPFEANEQNDYIALDHVLDAQSQRVVVDICIEPIDVTAISTAHTQRQEWLMRIQRAWRLKDDLHFDFDPLGEKSHSQCGRQILEPLHEPDPAAQDIQRLQQPMQDSFRSPYFRFHTVVLAPTTSAARLVASTVAEGAFEDGSYHLHTDGRKSAVSYIRKAMSTLTPIDSGMVLDIGNECPSGLSDLIHTASLPELAGLFRFPVAGAGSLHCIRTNTDPPVQREEDLILLGHDPQISLAVPSIPRGIVARDMALSVFITGMPGNGKTTAELNMAIQLAGRDVPILFIECAKTETRALKLNKNDPLPALRKLARGLQVYTPGNETLSPLRHSLLDVVPGVSIPEAIDAITRCFESSMPTGGPVISILVEALELVYDLMEDPSTPPSIPDLIAAMRSVMSSKNYSASTAADIEAAIDTRLGRLTRGTVGDVFRCIRSVPNVTDLFHSHTAIELNRLDEYTSSLFVLSLLTQLRASLCSMPRPSRVPRLIIFFSEAHRLLGRTKGAAPSDESPDPQAYVVKTVCHMLAELRALGVGVIISDQMPSAVAPEIIKLTGSKLTFRLVDTEDREAIGAAMLFGQDEMDNIARLHPGEAYLFTKGYYAPRLINTINIHEAP